MTSQARMATGIKLLYNGTVYAELIGDVTEPPFSVEKVDATSHDSTYKVSIPGQASWGDLKFNVNFINDPSQAALRVLALAKTVGIWRLVYPSNFSFLTYSVPGFVSGLNKKLPLKGAAASWEITITPTEAVNEVTAAGEPLTTTFFSMAEDDSNAMTPAETPAAATYVYNYTTASDIVYVKLTPICATSGTTLYVDGTVVATTVASGEIAYTVAAYPTGKIKTFFVVVDKAAVCPVIYQFNLIRGTVAHV